MRTIPPSSGMDRWSLSPFCAPSQKRRTRSTHAWREHEKKYYMRIRIPTSHTLETSTSCWPADLEKNLLSRNGAHSLAMSRLQHITPSSLSRSLDTGGVPRNAKSSPGPSSRGVSGVIATGSPSKLAAILGECTPRPSGRGDHLTWCLMPSSLCMLPFLTPFPHSDRHESPVFTGIESPARGGSFTSFLEHLGVNVNTPRSSSSPLEELHGSTGTTSQVGCPPLLSSFPLLISGPLGGRETPCFFSPLHSFSLLGGGVFRYCRECLPPKGGQSVGEQVLAKTRRQYRARMRKGKRTEEEEKKRRGKRKIRTFSPLKLPPHLMRTWGRASQ